MLSVTTQSSDTKALIFNCYGTPFGQGNFPISSGQSSVVIACLKRRPINSSCFGVDHEAQCLFGSALLVALVPCPAFSSALNDGSSSRALSFFRKAS